MTLHDLVGVELPIVQAPMAGVQLSALAIAVSNAGGLGSLPCAMLEPDALCAELDGKVLVHGSPAQRRLPEGNGAAEARKRGIEAFAAIAEDAQRAGVTYCIEALATPDANFVNTVEEAIGIVQQIGNRHVRTMLDCSAGSLMETEPLAALLDRHLPTGMIAHVQFNDRNRRGPGQGEDRFAPVVRALRETGYRGWIAMEPFVYEPDGPTCAARMIGYVAGLLEQHA